MKSDIVIVRTQKFASNKEIDVVPYGSCLILLMCGPYSMKRGQKVPISKLPGFVTEIDPLSTIMKAVSDMSASDCPPVLQGNYLNFI